MRGSLLSSEFYNKLISMKSFSDVVEALADTPYKKEVEECLVAESTPSAVDEALKRNITRTFRRVQTYVNKEARELLNLLLSRWDIHNIKTILRGKHIQAPEEEIIEGFVPVGELDEVLLLELVKQPDIKACVDLMATWDIPYARPLTSAMPDYLEEKNLVVLELALDRYYYTYALKKVKGRSINRKLVSELILSNVDITNIITLLRLQDVDFEKLRTDLRQKTEKRLREEIEEAQKEEEEIGETEEGKGTGEELPIETGKAKEGEEEKAEGTEGAEGLQGEVEETPEGLKVLKELKEEARVEEEKEKAEAEKQSYGRSYIGWVKKAVAGGVNEVKGLLGELREGKKLLTVLREKRKEKKEREKAKLGVRAKQAANSAWRSTKSFFTLPTRESWMPHREKKRPLATRKELKEKAFDDIEKIAKVVDEKVDDLIKDLILDFYIAGGKAVDEKQFLSLARKSDAMEIIEDLKGTPYGKVLEKISVKYLETDRVSIIERAMEELLIKKAVKMYDVDPLCFGVILSYIWAKYNEMVNLRIIVRGKAVSMPERHIREELVVA